jgi:hypothetical protein
MKTEEEVQEKLASLKDLEDTETGEVPGRPYIEGYLDALSWTLGELD